MVSGNSNKPDRISLLRLLLPGALTIVLLVSLLANTLLNGGGADYAKLPPEQGRRDIAQWQEARGAGRHEPATKDEGLAASDREEIGSHAVSPVDRMQDVMGRLDELRGQDDRRFHIYQRLLEELMGLGPVDEDKVIELLSDMSFDFERRSFLFGQLLQKSSHPGIPDAAEKALFHNLERGHDAYKDTEGYFCLLARMGGERQRRAVIEHLVYPGQCATAAAESIAFLNDPSLMEDILDVARSSPLCGTILEGLAQWDSRGVQVRLLELADDADAEMIVRQNACRAALASAEVGFGEFVSRYWALEADDDTWVYLQGLRGILQNDGAREQLSDVAPRVLEDILGSSSNRNLLKESIWLIRDSDDLQTPGVLGRLRDLTFSEDVDVAAEARRLLAKLGQQ